MGVHDTTIYTAVCDVGDCEEMHGDGDDWSWNWCDYRSDAERDAIRDGWTKVDDVLICKMRDAEHDEARGVVPDTRPKPGFGQLRIV